MFAPKHLETIELPKVLERLAGFCAFSASADLARQLSPTPILEEALALQAETTQARAALERNSQLSIGAVHDMREAARAAARGAQLDPQTLLDLRDTLASARNVQRQSARLGGGFERLADLAAQIEPCVALQEAIEAAIDDRAEVRDSASPRLQELRAQTRAARERLIGRLQRLIHDHPVWLQEGIITQRGGNDFDAHLWEGVHSRRLAYE